MESSANLENKTADIDTISSNDCNKNENFSNNWYIVNVFSGKERSILLELQKRLKDSGLYEYLEDSIVPFKEVESIKNGKKTKRDKIIYSGYILVKIKLDKFKKIIPEVKSIINNTNGVLKLINEKVSKSDFDNMISALNEMSFDSSKESSAFINKTVIIKDSVMKGFEGVVIEYDKESKIYTIRIKIFDKNVDVKLKENQFSLKNT